MKKIASLFSAFMLCLTLTACGSSEPATAPSVTESEKSIVQEKLNKNKNSSETTNETKEIATPQIGTTKETDAISKKETADTTQESSSATTATSLKQNEPESNADKGNETSKQDEQKTEPTTAVTEPQPTEPTVDKTNILVAYFSRADENYSVGTIEIGNTQILGEYIASEVGANSFHIETVTPYPANYKECCDVAKKELNDKARPEIIGTVDMVQYDIVFLGYPIWWGDMPMAVYTFMERYDWSEKVVIPFCTHEGSGLSGTDSSITSVTGAQVLTAIDMRGSTAQELNDDTKQTVRTWLNNLGF